MKSHICEKYVVKIDDASQYTCMEKWTVLFNVNYGELSWGSYPSLLYKIVTNVPSFFTSRLIIKCGSGENGFSSD